MRPASAYSPGLGGAGPPPGSWVAPAAGKAPRPRRLRSSSSFSRTENLRTVVGPVRRCGQARSSLAWRHVRGCPRRRKTTAPRSAFWPIAHVVILGRQRPQAATREHGVRALDPSRMLDARVLGALLVQDLHG